ncbi:MAG: hypothetical protein ABJH63_12575 [Rhizobiaceae bacterium]
MFDAEEKSRSYRTPMEMARLIGVSVQALNYHVDQHEIIAPRINGRFKQYHIWQFGYVRCDDAELGARPAREAEREQNTNIKALYQRRPKTPKRAREEAAMARATKAVAAL